MTGHRPELDVPDQDPPAFAGTSRVLGKQVLCPGTDQNWTCPTRITVGVG
ncbi:hypothetical protein TIFTF001_045510 [Ficus carica]|uniref:Uncharacterized protein n=1 Tax=Ficus carica TaxID=3494 RepID=A0AA88CLY3_FICCA|nr:hypothetical protein TIFTF001_045510 [Ficus carica]